MNWLNALTHWHWLILAIVLLIAEVSVGGGFLLWIGISALVVSLVVWVIPVLHWGLQLLLFSIVAIVSTVLWWAYLKKHPIATDEPTLNRRSEQYIGRQFNLTEPIVNGRGRIRVDGIMWSVNGPDLPLGTKVKIISANGVVLICEKVE